MNKTENINLGGKPFIIDQNAFYELERYLQAIKLQFSQSQGGTEIIKDIEIRIAELFTEYNKHGEILSQEHVKKIISVMGRPEDFGDIDSGERSNDESGSFQNDQSNSEKNFNPGKKLYRDTDEKIVAGVCSGISIYFGITDPIWVRLLFVVFTISGGAGILIYLVAWFLMPEAKTTSDRLRMRGESINISSIADDFAKEFTDLGEKFSELGKDFNWKTGKKKSNK